MNTRIIVATLAVLFAAGCFPDVDKGKARAAVQNTPLSSVQVEKAAPAQDERTVAIDSSKSKIAAVGAKITRAHDIAFDRWSGTMTTSGGELSGLEIEIAMTSLRADEPKLSEHLKSPDFFDVAKFPVAQFKATQVDEKRGADGATHVVTGRLTLHGVTKEVSFPAKVEAGPSGLAASTEFVIDRQDFGIAYPGMPDDLIKDEVVLTISLVGGKAEA